MRTNELNVTHLSPSNRHRDDSFHHHIPPPLSTITTSPRLPARHHRACFRLPTRCDRGKLKKSRGLSLGWRKATDSNSMASATASIVEAISFSSRRFSEMRGIVGGWLEIVGQRLMGCVPRTYENLRKIFAIAKRGNQTHLPNQASLISNVNLLK